MGFMLSITDNLFSRTEAHVFSTGVRQPGLQQSLASESQINSERASIQPDATANIPAA